MEFAIPTFFVLAPGNTLPVAGSTDALTGTTFGVYDNKYTAVTAANIAAKPYIYFVQNRKVQMPDLGTKKSEKIFKQNVLLWYKVPSKTTITHQVTEVGNFHGKCDEDLSITLRLFSNHIEQAYFNGLTRSFTIKAPCCDCENDAPCVDVDAEGLVNQFVAAINADTIVSKFVVATKNGVGATAKIVITGKLLDRYGNPCSPTAFPYEYDRLRFDTFAHRGADTTQDFISYNRCDVFATVQVTATSGYPTGEAEEIYQLEKRYFSYQATHKSIFSCMEFNGHFERETIPGLYYTTYYLKIKDPNEASMELSERMNEWIILAIPAGEEAPFEALVTPFLGVPEPVNIM